LLELGRADRFKTWSGDREDGELVWRTRGVHCHNNNH